MSLYTSKNSSVSLCFRGERGAFDREETGKPEYGSLIKQEKENV